MASRSMRFWSHSPLALIVLVGAPGALFAACTLNTTGVEAEASTSGASAGTSSSSGVGGEGGSGGALPPPVEDCTDGKDNDGNGLEDCADPACEPGYECVKSVPSGFERYVRVHTGAGGAGGAGGDALCPDGSAPLKYYVGPAKESAECSACSCTWAGASCSTPELSCYYDKNKDNMCGGLPELVAKGNDLVCDVNPDVPWDDKVWCKLTAPGAVASQGTCDKSGGVLAASPAWQDTVDVCPIEKAGGGCMSGNVCVPRGGSGSSELCIDVASDQPCPGEWSASPIKAYEDVKDNRSCAPCDCNVDSISCSDAYYIVYDVDSCFGGKREIHSADCVDVSDLLDNTSGAVRPVAGKPSEGTCSGGEPTGKVEPEKPHTICCK